MGLKLAGVMLIIMISMGGIGYWYYTDTQEKMAILNQNNAKLEQATNLQKETIKNLEGDIQLAQSLAESLQNQVKEFKKQIDDERTKFNKVSKLLGSRDIGKMAASKPDSIQKILNKGTMEKLRCFEIATGAKLTEKENNATKPSQLNNSCPSIANPNRVQ
jgi:DNA-binding transcriptional regulator GbsR (MarR family)